MKQLHLLLMNFVLLEKNCGDLKVRIKMGNKEMLPFPPSTTSALGLSGPTKKCLLFVSSYSVNLCYRIEVIICSVVEWEILILSLKMHQEI